PDGNRVLVAAHPDLRIVFGGDDPPHDAYQAELAPAAVVVAGNGRVASAVHYGTDAVAELRTWARAESEQLRNSHVAPDLARPVPPGRTVGAPAPVGAAPRTDGTHALVFWQDSCTFCQALSDELVAYEVARVPEQPKLVVVSLDEGATTAAFASPVVL